MGFLKQKVEPTADQIGLATALSHLFGKIGRDNDYQKILDRITGLDTDSDDVWNVVNDIHPDLGAVTVGLYGSWPESNDAIIKFQIRPDDQPDIEVAGQMVPNIINHFCTVADFGDRQIIDSADGIKKNGNIYGNPVAWAMFGAVEVQPEEDEDPAYTYKVLSGGESLWTIARKTNMDVDEIKALNDITDYFAIPAGTKITLPQSLPEKIEPRGTRIELLETPKQMHVSRDGGTRKVTFGSAKMFEAIEPTGPTYHKNTNLWIYAIAHVPFTENGEEVTAAYLLDALALGNFERTGRVAWEIGFNHSHLAEGHVEKDIVEITAVPAELETKLEEVKQTVEPDGPPAVSINEKNLWQSTYEPLEGGPTVYVSNEDLTVHDLEGMRQSRTLPKLNGVRIEGTFYKGGVLYGRPQRGEKSSHWYGVPMDLLIPEDELFLYEEALPDRVINHGKLSITERYISVPLSKALNHRFLKKHVDRLRIK